MLLRTGFLVLVTLSAVVLAVPKPDEKRVLDHEFGHHMQEDEHDKQYDHEAFLGEEAKTFDQLPPEESRRRLA